MQACNNNVLQVKTIWIMSCKFNTCLVSCLWLDVQGKAEGP